MKKSDYSFSIDDSQIALYPAQKRDQSQLVSFDEESQNWSHAPFSSIVNHFGPDDVLVLNKTAVLPARSTFQRTTGGIVELLWVPPASDDFAWQAMGQTRRLKVGEELTSTDGELSIQILSRQGDTIEAKVPAHFDSWLKEAANLALPPYIVKQRTEKEWGEDKTRYQTVFAEDEGSIAAPTASLHWTNDLLAQLRAKGTEITYLVHHVGPGTFKPIRAEKLQDHRVDAEWSIISAETAEILNKAKKSGKRITAGGTTACRSLEANVRSNGSFSAFSGLVDLTILPGDRFKACDRLLTNFHLPESSLLLLVAAAIPTRWRSLYAYALQEKLRFYSYGDCSLFTID